MPIINIMRLRNCTMALLRDSLNNNILYNLKLINTLVGRMTHIFSLKWDVIHTFVSPLALVSVFFCNLTSKKFSFYRIFSISSGFFDFLAVVRMSISGNC